MANTTNTAAGPITLIDSAHCALRTTTMFFGRLADGRFTVASRFQWEIRTKHEAKARALFIRLTEQS